MTVVEVVLAGRPGRMPALLAAVRAAPGLRVAETVTLPGRVPAAAAALRRGVLIVDAGVEGGAAAVVQAVMAASPVPILVLAPGLSGQAVDLLLRAGAVEVRTEAELAGIGERCAVLAGVGVVRRSGPRTTTTPSAARPRAVLAVGASTGGPQALVTLFAGLAALAVPVLVVQHIAADFLPGLAVWLAGAVPQPVRVVQDGDVAEAGTVHLAPADRHLLLLPDGRLSLSAEPAGLHVPSVDALFHSVAACQDTAAVGVLLTGMGRDGAEGLLALRRSGARTLAQDQATSAVFGMPKVAQELGAAETVLPLEDLAAAVLAILGTVPR